MTPIVRPPSEPMRIGYGPDPNQFGELSVPGGPGPWPGAVVIHGGFWRARYDLSLGAALARDLVARGFAVWNIEYRRVGNGGGWPTTVIDVAAAVDRLADMDGLDLSRVIALGHSAGGHLAAWLAGRPQLDSPFGPPAVPLTGAVCQAGVLDLETAGTQRLGDGAVNDFAGGRLAKAADWRTASPIRQLPIGVPIRCIHGDRDDTVPIEQSVRYVAAAQLLGVDARLIIVPGGDHFGVITPDDPGWTASVQAVEELAAAS